MFYSPTFSYSTRRIQTRVSSCKGKKLDNGSIPSCAYKPPRLFLSMPQHTDELRLSSTDFMIKTNLSKFRS